MLVKKRGKSVYNGYFKLKYLENGGEFSCFSVIISAKISKKAVVRNKLRRQSLEIIRLALDKIKPGYNVLIWPNNKALDLDYQLLETNLLALFKRAFLLK
ncbi:MAG: ribonuclease P protein component [Candidatus Buchananbacteria bacterium]|nr:ribonuclease P protein component [Candidatus Buchananbacteria bacterium]